MLVIDTATAACSVASVDDGAVVARTHEIVSRGHAERLVPMIAELPEGGRADRILVDCGPGSFTGLRVGIAAARGLGLGWGVPVSGYSSLALLAAAGFARTGADELAVVMEGGHGEVFMQAFANPLIPLGDAASLKPADALAALAGRRAIGGGARLLAALDPSLAPDESLPDAADAVLLPPAFTMLPPKPIYGRAPDAKPMATPV